MSDLVERLRDDNSDYVYTERHEAAARITALETALATVQRAAKTIMIHEADELRELRDERVKWHQAITTLDSERQANALLTDRVEALETALAEARNAAFEEAARACEAHMSQCLEDRDIQKRWPQIKARNAVYAQAIRDMKDRT